MSAARRLIVEAETVGVPIYVRDGKAKVAYRGQPPRDFLVRPRAATSEIAWELLNNPRPRPTREWTRPRLVVTGCIVNLSATLGWGAWPQRSTQIGSKKIRGIVEEERRNAQTAQTGSA